MEVSFVLSQSVVVAVLQYPWASVTVAFKKKKPWLLNSSKTDPESEGSFIKVQIALLVLLTASFGSTKKT